MSIESRPAWSSGCGESHESIEYLFFHHYQSTKVWKPNGVRESALPEMQYVYLGIITRRTWPHDTPSTPTTPPGTSIINPNRSVMCSWQLESADALHAIICCQ